MDTLDVRVQAVIASLILNKRRGSAAMNASAVVVNQGLQRLVAEGARDGMARYGVPSDKAFGLPVGKI